MNRQCLVVVSPSAADFALYVHIRQKIHFDSPLPFPLASFASSTSNVERKSSGLVSSLARFGEHGVDIADPRKNSRKGSRIRSRRPPNRRLIDANHFVDQFRSGYRFVLSRLFTRTI